MEKKLDWKTKEAIARRMTIDELNYAIHDCMICVAQRIDEGYYYDEASVYRSEINRRERKVR